MKAFLQQALRGKVTGAEEPPVRPAPGPAAVSIGLTLAAVVAVLLAGHHGQGFRPRSDAIDAVAGLALGAFLVDRLLTFVYPWGGVRATPKERAVDIAFLRLGYGAAIGAVFVAVTDLRAIRALSPDGPAVTSAGVDRVIAVLAIAGGVAGLARLLSGINPQPPTDKTAEKTGKATIAAQATAVAKKAIKAAVAAGADPAAHEPTAAAVAHADAAAAQVDAPETLPPAPEAYALGAVALVLAGLLALVAAGDTTGLDLVGPKPVAAPAAAVVGGPTAALVLRFGTVILLATIIEQVIERTVAPFLGKPNKALITGAVALTLGVAAAAFLDIFLLHNVGFFGAGTRSSLSDALAHSSHFERWFDTFATGAVIAGGTKPLHDLSSRLKKQAAPAA
ncbi:MAG TPA: hypothetical protein VL120_16535 [Solirubrobacteraceae bacterium]|nr:hypothetical protein [Solirubrobacteraceae bacterium]